MFKSTSGGVTQWEARVCVHGEEKSSHRSLSSAEAELHAQTTGTAEGMVTKHLLKELGHEATLVNRVDSRSAKAWASKRGMDG